MFKFLTILIHIINLLTIIYMVFKEKRSPNNIIAWMLILYIAPFIGFIIFLLVGRKMNKTNMFGIKNSKIKVLEEYNKIIKERTKLQLENSNFKNSDMVMALENIDYSPYRDDNEVCMYSDGKEFFDALLKSLSKAKKV
ncbi:PLDc N-terminal domain-containing protein [uncultured Clostridium sp.]|uniref:PLDc N-terminal domain-containing protein n=1 Tax=uncultured Clostridium sp. TaxID=59620 RepID=UPI00272E8FAC|nr:PLDc N-terminal domain-containing protein [uncultured Clostridium sp.]